MAHPEDQMSITLTLAPGTPGPITMGTFTAGTITIGAP
jgi:hypothetical protein